MVWSARSWSFNSSRSFASAAFVSPPPAAPPPGGHAEGREHLHRLLEHLGVPAHLLLRHLHGDLHVARHRVVAEGLRQLLAHLLLLRRESGHRLLEIARQHHLHLVAVVGDQLPQKGDRQKRVAGLRFLLEDDLREDGVGDVLARLRVLNREILALLHHDGEVVEGHVAARPGIVQSPVGVFLDDRRAFVLRHALPPSDFGRCSQDSELRRKADCMTIAFVHCGERHAAQHDLPRCSATWARPAGEACMSFDLRPRLRQFQGMLLPQCQQ